MERAAWLLRSYKTCLLHHLIEDKYKERRLHSHASSIVVMPWLCTGSYTRLNSALAAQGHQGIRDNEQTGSEHTEIHVKVSCETVINVIKMIMFISMYLLKIIQLVTVQQLLMFHFWAAEQIPCSTSDLIRYQPSQHPCCGCIGGVLHSIGYVGGCWLQENTFLAWFAVEHVYSRNGFKERKGGKKIMYQSHDVSWKEICLSRCVCK